MRRPRLGRHADAPHWPALHRPARPLKAQWPRIGCFPAIMLTGILVILAAIGFRAVSLASGLTCYVVTVDGQTFNAISVTPEGNSVHIITREGRVLITNSPYSADLGPCR
ncbi:hypothetical protein [Deinococcus kurensis]|uniref:hypothetical protein n=1 Tax=Deinococcus kurensis TaxID=2662757 RepID=UPI0012D2F732|nr:hypothetical protein [Deinococcus kurensis]